MTREERVKALMGHAHNPVKDEKILTAASEEMLTALEKHAAQADEAEQRAAEDEDESKEEEERDAAKGKGKSSQADGSDDSDMEDDADEDDSKDSKKSKGRSAEQPEKKEKTEEEWLLDAPESIRTMVSRHKATDAKVKTDLVGRLKTAQKVFTEKQLNSKSVEELQDIAALVKLEEPKVDYAGRTPRAAEEGDYLRQPPPDGYRIALEKQAAARKH